MPDIPSPPVLLSGLSMSAQSFKDLLARFDAYLHTTAAPYSATSPQPQAGNTALASRQKSTLLGTYEKTFSGEELADWLKENVEGFGGEWERAESAASELYKLGNITRTGVGRGFEASSETFYVLKSAAGEVGFHNPLSPSTSVMLPSLLKSYLPASLGSGLSDEPVHVRLRREAGKADENYKEGVRNAEEKRLEMEERIERGLRVWERWERDRLGIVKTVLRQYEEALAKLPARLGDLQKSTSLSVEAFNPEADIVALIEGNRTGPFRPQPHIYESVESDVPEVNFGIDLRRWSGDQGWKALVNAPPRPKGAIPDALQALLLALKEMYTSVPDDERRKAWIYEVPLVETHMLRNLINNPQIELQDMVALVKKFNIPVAAGVVKLYLLELSPPVLGWEGWEDAKAVYPAVGADQERDMTSAVTSVLGRLPGAQLFVLDAVVAHLKELISSTKSEEADAMYITKLALSVGRTILRPQYETEMTIQDRTPSLFLADLITLYSSVFPPLVEKKKKDVDRVMPVRKRTALVDQRISRSRLSYEQDPQEVLASGLGTSRPVIEEPEPVEQGKRKEKEKEMVNVVPPTPEQPSDERMVESPVVPMDGAGDGATGLKRAASGETSRLRGPRGARGPRPAPGRIVSHSNAPSMGSIASSPTDPAIQTPAPAAADIKSPKEDVRPPPSLGAVDPSDYAPRRGKGGASAGAFGHGTRGSVSAIAAQFEGK
ncbi:hypothetical protein P7C73_g5840, partial [Tremellales sp. Uapishka_1]